MSWQQRSSTVWISSITNTPKELLRGGYGSFSKMQRTVAVKLRARINRLWKQRSMWMMKLLSSATQGSPSPSMIFSDLCIKLLRSSEERWRRERFLRKKITTTVRKRKTRNSRIRKEKVNRKRFPSLTTSSMGLRQRQLGSLEQGFSQLIFYQEKSRYRESMSTQLIVPFITSSPWGLTEDQELKLRW